MVTRRGFVRSCALGAAALASTPILGSGSVRAGASAGRSGPASRIIPLDGASKPELRIDGFVGSKRVLSRAFSSDPSHDQLWLKADDGVLIADGSDATRLAFRAVDKFGAPRPFVSGEFSLGLSGPGVMVGDNPFRWDDSGGAGAVWIKTVPGRTGRIKVTASHATLGKKSVEITVRGAV